MGAWNPGPGPTAGDDTFTGDGSGESANGGDGNDSLNGGAGDDSLVGGSGDDTLDGGAGADTLLGNAGDDTYIVDNENDLISDFAGLDTVFATAASYTLPEGIEHLIFTGAGNFTGVGNGYWGSIVSASVTGGAGNDTLSNAQTLNGGAGNDVLRSGATMNGEAGDDILYASTGSILNGGTGDDVLVAISGAVELNRMTTFNGGDGTDYLGINNGVYFDGALNSIEGIKFIGGTWNTLTLTHDAFASLPSTTLVTGSNVGGDFINISDYHDPGPARIDLSSWTFVNWSSASIWITGGSAADTMRGSSQYDFIIGNDGSDRIYGGGGGDCLRGDAGADDLFGEAGDDTLYGGADNDSLNGGNGADTLDGGGGDDIYYVDDAGDVVTESTGGGADVVRATVTHTLGANVENLLMLGSAGIWGGGNALANVIIGNSGANKIWTNEGNDFLDGGLGADTMIGGAGNDVYYIDQAGDVVQEDANAGIDTVRSSISNVLGANFENMLLVGAANSAGGGNGLNNLILGGLGNNKIWGGVGNDTLSGGAGNDTIHGGAGLDFLTGGAGADAFMFDTAPVASLADRITDFSVADDAIWLENAIFTKFAAAGALNAAFFRVGAAAADANDYIIYNSANGALYYDSNGNAAGGSTLIAMIGANHALTSADFLVV